MCCNNNVTNNRGGGGGGAKNIHHPSTSLRDHHKYAIIIFKGGLGYEVSQLGVAGSTGSLKKKKALFLIF